MGMIEEMYNNSISFAEGFGYPYNSEWRIMSEDCEELKLKLISLLNQDEQELLEDILDLKMQMAGFELERMFSYGFRTGAKLLIDIHT